MRVYEKTALERFAAELGRQVRSADDAMCAEIEWEAVMGSTPAQRRETDRLKPQGTIRGIESDLVSAAIWGQGSAGGQYDWDCWDLHLQEALAQHARVLGLTEMATEWSVRR